MQILTNSTLLRLLRKWVIAEINAQSVVITIGEFLKNKILVETLSKFYIFISDVLENTPLLVKDMEKQARR